MIEEKYERRLDEGMLIEKIRKLPPDKISEVFDFVEFLNQKEEELASIRAAGKLSEPSFADIWNNPEDDGYDRL
jgi:hypothetical protein